MNIKHFLSLGTLTFVSLGLTLSISATSKNGEHFEIVQADVTSYYKDISDNMTGNDLLGALNKLNNAKRKKMIGYDDLRYVLNIFDADPNGSGKIVGFYDNKLVGPNWDYGNTWNREHVWPKSRGGNKVDGDAHMTRPASTQTNSDRGSKGFGTATYDPGKYVAYYRGVASRIIFYAAIADTSLKLVDLQLAEEDRTPANSMGSLSDMLKWNLEYKPQDTTFTGQDELARITELNRNNLIETHSKGQGNRNPFIDHPEYACRIWGNTNEKTKQICGGGGGTDTPDVPGDLKSITLSIKEKKLEVGETLQLDYVTDPASIKSQTEISWYSDDESVAKVDGNGKVTAIKDGVTKIHITTLDFQFKDECVITVGTGKSSSSAGGCGGNIVFTSTILSSISLLGIALLLLKKRTV